MFFVYITQKTYYVYKIAYCVWKEIKVIKTEILGYLPTPSSDPLQGLSSLAWSSDDAEQDLYSKKWFGSIDQEWVCP